MKNVYILNLLLLEKYVDLFDSLEISTTRNVLQDYIIPEEGRHAEVMPLYVEVE